MRSDDRAALRSRFHFRCGYCGVSETDVGAELTVDHFQPISRGGTDDLDNWVYCCHACNEFKGDYWKPDSPDRILHPLRDPLPEHTVERDDGTLCGLTRTGTFHIEKLRLNRPQLIAHRQERRFLGIARQAQARLLDRMAELEAQVQSLSEQLERFVEGDPTATSPD